MRNPFRKTEPETDDLAMASLMRQAMLGSTSEAQVSLNAVGSAQTVQRTRRVVRQQIVSEVRRRRRMRSILAAAFVCSALLAVLSVPLWNELDAFAHWSGVPDLQIHMLFLGVWFLPATAVSLLLWRGYRKSIAQSR